MGPYRSKLPQLSGDIFVTDGGIETCLIFHENLDLPDFAAFTLLQDSVGRAALDRYYRPYLEVAARRRLGFILESATWRASADWGMRLGYSADALADANRNAIALLSALRTEFAERAGPIVISGCVGPRGDGYDPGAIMSEVEAEAYHGAQIAAFASTDADMATAITMTNTPEAIGLARAAKAVGLPVVISFTLETDGRLPTGQSLGEAIEMVDAATDRYPAYYMINCAHPTHFADTISTHASWASRLRGLRTNASKLSHAELDEAETLDDGDPAELGRENADLRHKLPSLNVFGGCCGTDHRHIAAMADELGAYT